MKLVIDTDPGIDDAMAIFYAAQANNIELLGLTTIFGNVTVEIATRNALRLAEMLGLDIPVAAGASRPLMQEPHPPSQHVHGAEGFGEIPAEVPERRAVDETAAEMLCRLAREHRGELVVCAIGPITNVALAIQVDPEFVRNVKRIVFMGGAAFVPGNVTPHAEANTWNDPHALNVVIGSGADVVMVGLDVTMKVLCTSEYFAALEAASPQFGGFLQRASKFYLDFYKRVAGMPGCGLHDPAAVIAATDPELFEIQRLPIIVRERGDEVGRTVNDVTGATIGVCVDGDMAAVLEKFGAAFGLVGWNAKLASADLNR